MSGKSSHGGYLGLGGCVDNFGYPTWGSGPRGYFFVMSLGIREKIVLKVLLLLFNSGHKVFVLC